jgi:hypothetical protein
MAQKMRRGAKVTTTPFRRPAWKLLVKSLVYTLPVALRNWRHRRHGDYPVMSSTTIWFLTTTSLRSFDGVLPAAGELPAAALPRSKSERGSRSGAERRGQDAHRRHHFRRRVRRQFCEPARHHRRIRLANRILHLDRTHLEWPRICPRSDVRRTRVSAQHLGGGRISAALRLRNRQPYAQSRRLRLAR